ncbi:MAG TPA: cupin domain-containing protein [Herpetosiphonaceae bacterium]
MIQAGFIINNPLTGSVTQIIESDAAGMLLEVTSKAGAKPDIAEHVHRTWTETFEVIRGTARCSVGGVQRTLQAGEVATVQPGQKHIHPWSAGADELVFRQRSTFAQPSPTAVQDVLGTFATIADLARAGKVDRQGMPKNPLQMAAALRMLAKHGGYDTRMPIGLQNGIAATLGWLAERLGYRGVDPRYLRP